MISFPSLIVFPTFRREHLNFLILEALSFLLLRPTDLQPWQRPCALLVGFLHLPRPSSISPGLSKPPSDDPPLPSLDIKDKTGPASSLYINTIPKPIPSPGQALVHIKCFGLNRMDLLQREGHYPLPPQAGPILGVEFSGVIEAFGGEATTDKVDEPGIATTTHQLAIGDEVLGLAYGGAYAEYIAVSTHMLIHKPASLSFEAAAGIPETWITALQALYLVAELPPGKSVLWHAGASAVSIAGIQLSKKSLGCDKIYVTASSAEKISFCEALGASKGFNYKDPAPGCANWSEELLKQETAGKGVDCIIDFIGASYFAQNLAAIAPDGVIVHLGLMGGAQLPAGTSIMPFVAKRIRFQGSSLRARSIEYQRKLRDMLEERIEGFREGKVGEGGQVEAEDGQGDGKKKEEGKYLVFVEKVFDWREIRQAHELMERNTTKGKIICRVDW